MRLLLLFLVLFCLSEPAGRAAGEESAGPAPVLSLLLSSGHGGPVLALSVSPDGRTLATAADAEIYLLDARTGTFLSFAPLPDGLSDLAFSPDGTRLFRANGTGEIIPYGVEGRQLHHPAGAHFQHPKGRTALVVAPSGTVFTAGQDGSVQRWQGTQATPIIQPSGGKGFRGLALSPGGERLAAVGEGGRVSLWDVTRSSRLGN